MANNKTFIMVGVAAAVGFFLYSKMKFPFGEFRPGTWIQLIVRDTGAVVASIRIISVEDNMVTWQSGAFGGTSTKEELQKKIAATVLSVSYGQPSRIEVRTVKPQPKSSSPVLS